MTWVTSHTSAGGHPRLPARPSLPTGPDRWGILVPLGERGVLHPGRWRWLQALTWCVLMFFLTAGAFGFPLQAAADLLPPGNAAVQLVGVVVACAAALSCYALAVRLGEGRAARELALRPALPGLAVGATLGLAMMALLMGVMVLTGLYDIALVGAAPWVGLGQALQAAVTEELWMRALLFRLVWRAVGPVPAFAVAAVVFGALHLANPGATALAGVTAAMAGLMFCALYALTGRLWVPIGLHLAWNFAQGYLFGAAVSGNDLGGSIAVSTANTGAQSWLTGGTFGPEASVFALLLVSSVTMAALRLAGKTGRFAARPHASPPPPAFAEQANPGTDAPHDPRPRPQTPPHERQTVFTKPAKTASPARSGSTMRAVVQHEYGPADVLHIEQINRPQVTEDEVLLQVHAAGLDRGTWHLMTGKPYLLRLVFGLRRPNNPVPGLDVAGTVIAVGPAVTRFGLGDEVYGFSRGSFAEYTVAREAKLAPKPANLSFEQAAVVPVSAGTALQALDDFGHLQAGQKVLVIGASGGVGSYAVQLAKAFGAKVTGVASTAKLDLVQSLGADHVLDYQRADFAAIGHRYDLILDIGGRPSLARLRQSLTPTGTAVLVGGEEGGNWTGGLGRTLRALVLSLLTRQRLTNFVAKQRSSDLERLSALIEAGQVVPVVDATYLLEQVSEAMRHLEEGRVRGKVAILV